MLTVGQERSLLNEIGGGSGVCSVAFTANGEYIVGGDDGLGVWRVKDGERMAAMAARDVCCLAVSKDGRWIAAGTPGECIVWDAQTLEKVFTHREDLADILGVDFSPDSTRLVAASMNRTAAVWDVATHRRILTVELIVYYFISYRSIQ